MRILILISAFLAALTGGVAHARAAGPVAEVSVSAAARVERLVQAAPFVAAAAIHSKRVVVVIPDAANPPASRIPLYADRLLI